MVFYLVGLIVAPVVGVWFSFEAIRTRRRRRGRWEYMIDLACPWRDLRWSAILIGWCSAVLSFGAAMTFQYCFRTPVWGQGTWGFWLWMLGMVVLGAGTSWFTLKRAWQEVHPDGRSWGELVERARPAAEVRRDAAEAVRAAVATMLIQGQASSHMEAFGKMCTELQALSSSGTLDREGSIARENLVLSLAGILLPAAKWILCTQSNESISKKPTSDLLELPESLRDTPNHSLAATPADAVELALAEVLVVGKSSWPMSEVVRLAVVLSAQAIENGESIADKTKSHETLKSLMRIIEPAAQRILRS